MKFMPFRLDYVNNWRFMSFIYAILAIAVASLAPVEIGSFFTRDSVLIAAVSTVTLCFSYWIVRRTHLFRTFSPHHTDFRSFKYRYLFTKTVEIIAQQIFIVWLIIFSSGSALVYATLFTAVHIPNFFYLPVKKSLFFLLASVPASLIFVLIYNLFPNIGLGIAYSVHIFFYALIGIILITYEYLKGKI